MVFRLILIICFGTFLFTQSIEETLEQIESLKKEIQDNTKIVDKKIEDLKKTNPLFSEQDVFESDLDYLERMTKAMPQLDNIRKQYLDDLWIKMSILRGRMFETKNIDINLDKNKYNANTETWPITITHRDYQQEEFNVTINITKSNAAALYKNWSKVIKTGILTIDVGDQVGLAKVSFHDPISGVRFSYDFQPMHRFDSLGKTDFSPDGNYLFISGADYYDKGVQYRLKDMKQVDSFDGRYGRAIVVSPDGKFVAHAYDDVLSIYHISTGKRIWSAEAYRCDALTFTPDSKYVLYKNSESLYIINREIGNVSASIDDVFIYDGNCDISMSPDGQYIATSCCTYCDQSGDYYYSSNKQRLVDLKSLKIIKKENKRGSVAFSPDGQYLFFGNTLYDIYDNKGGQLLSKKRKINNYRQVVISPDSKHLIWPDGNSLVFYNIETEEKRSIDTYSAPYNLSISPDGKYIAISGQNGNVELFRTFLQTEEEVLAQKAISKPPSLSASISFSEPSGNLFLDAMETGKFTLKIKNNGDGPGKGVLVKVSPERTEQLNYNNNYIEEISPGKTVSVDIPIEAYIGVADGDHTFRFDFEEINGFPPTPLEIQFSTKSYVEPEMYVADIGIEDDNQNGKIESGEYVTLTIRIGNQGKGTAKNSYAKFYGGTDVFFTDRYPAIVSLGDLDYNSSVDIPLEFFVNDKTKDKIPLYVDLTEETNLATVSKYRLPINKSERISTVGRTIVKGIEQEYGELSIGSDLSIDIEQNIPETGITKKHSVAIVIGNKNYDNPDVPEVTFAHRDAAIMEEYLTKTLGYDEILIETDATQGKFFALFGTEKKDGKLQDYVKKNESEVFIYYSGHGAPDPESKDGYFVPVDCDPSLVDVNGYSLDLFYKKLNQLKAKNITVVIDACFSGSSDQGMLLKNISPVFIETNDGAQLKETINVFTSSSGEQVSSWYPEKNHSLYTYYFLKGIKGAADLDGNNKISMEEIHSYVSEEVPYMARKLNSREQTPGLKSKDNSSILIQY